MVGWVRQGQQHASQATQSRVELQTGGTDMTLTILVYAAFGTLRVNNNKQPYPGLRRNGFSYNNLAIRLGTRT